MNLDHLLTEEDRLLRETMRSFTKKEIIPITKRLESDYGLVEEVHQKLVDMGIQASGIPVEYVTLLYKIEIQKAGHEISHPANYPVVKT